MKFACVVVQVSNTDTLASIAAQFDTTTSELKKSNRLMSDMVIPGKVSQHASTFSRTGIGMR